MVKLDVSEVGKLAVVVGAFSKLLLVELTRLVLVLVGPSKVLLQFSD